MSRDPALQALVDFWETLTPAAMARLGDFYAEQASFKDPFNEVQGLPAIHRIFDEMFRRLEEPRFRILQTVREGDLAFLVWDFTFRIKSLSPLRTRSIHGTTCLKLDPGGKVISHRDYWDAAGELYAQLPVLGGLMRLLARFFA